MLGLSAFDERLDPAKRGWDGWMCGCVDGSMEVSSVWMDGWMDGRCMYVWYV